MLVYGLTFIMKKRENPKSNVALIFHLLLAAVIIFAVHTMYSMTKAPNITSEMTLTCLEYQRY